MGAVLCNACGLFLKLHGRPRPLNLKTDVIKSRNRVKTSGQGPKRKSGVDSGLSASKSESVLTSGGYGYHRAARKGSPGHSDRSNSPVPRTDTPGFNLATTMPPTTLDGVSLAEHGINPSNPALSALQLQNHSPGSSSSSIDRHMDAQTYEGLLSANTALKTRVSELELINGLFRGRVSQLERSEEVSRRSEMNSLDSESVLRRSLEESQKREEDLKRRVSELEEKVKGLTQDQAGSDLEEPASKKARLSDEVSIDHAIG